jgi:hypothetical protein
VHLRGTDKVVRPKVPPEAYFPFIDAYLHSHKEDGLIFVATDDRGYMRRLGARYGFADGPLAREGRDGGGRIVSRGLGYTEADASWGGQADAVTWHQQTRRSDHARSGYTKGLQVILDALLLSKCDFVLISASAVAEFSLWIAPRLWDNHLDLQATDRFHGQVMPVWTMHFPGVSTEMNQRRRRLAVADVFCQALVLACANETARHRGRFTRKVVCNRCDPPKREAGRGKGKGVLGAGRGRAFFHLI